MNPTQFMVATALALLGFVIAVTTLAMQPPQLALYLGGFVSFGCFFGAFLAATRGVPS